MSAGGPPWRVEEWRASAADLHAADLLAPCAARRVVWMHADRPALVLGSAQRIETVDVAACASAGVDVVRRRSGGGAVLVEPGDLAWVDVTVPTGDPLADDDVGRAMWWLGDVWAEALARLGAPGAEVHRGPLVTTAWSRTVCFAGLGPGELTFGGSKVVGISQRRTRAGARFQCAVPLRWCPERVVSLLSPPRPTLADLPPVATVEASVEAISDAFNAVIATR